MNQVIHYLGPDVHKDSIAVSLAPANSTEVRRYGIIGGTLAAVDKLLKKLSSPGVELRLAYDKESSIKHTPSHSTGLFNTR